MEIWFLPCNSTPFLNRNHPVFLAIKDRVIGCEEHKILLEHFGLVRPEACCKSRVQAEEELFMLYEEMWLDNGLHEITRSTLPDYFQHAGIKGFTSSWFDLYSLIHEESDAASN